MNGEAGRTIAGVSGTDTPRAAKMLDYARHQSEPNLFNHVARSWLFVARIGQGRQIDNDGELVVLGTLLNDITLDERFHGPVASRWKASSTSAVHKASGTASPSTRRRQ